MTWTLLIYGLVPLIAFVVVDLYAGIKWAVAAAVVLATLDVFATYYLSGTWDPGAIAAAVLITGLGIWTVRQNNPVYVKFQPVAVAAVFALLLIYFQFFGGGLVHRYLPLLESSLPPEMQPMLADPEFVALLDRSVTGLIGVLIVHGLWVAYAALKMSNVGWLLVRGIGFWGIFFVYALGFALLIAVTGKPVGS